MCMLCFNVEILSIIHVNLLMCCSNYLAFSVSSAFAILILSDLLMLSLQCWRSGREMHCSPSPWKLSHSKKKFINHFLTCLCLTDERSRKRDSPLLKHQQFPLNLMKSFFSAALWLVQRAQTEAWRILIYSPLIIFRGERENVCVCLCVHQAGAFTHSPLGSFLLQEQ